MPAILDLWRRGQHGWPARYPLVQFPNAPLLVALAGSVAGRALHGGAHDAARVVFYAGLAAWAGLELTQGVNAVRRLAGAGVLAYVAVRLVQAA
ncbi:MAG: hypothetical protein JWP53_4253 [Conexibacter sp.]|nr:hypothetical protein [Conexibacter sp.]